MRIEADKSVHCSL